MVVAPSFGGQLLAKVDVEIIRALWVLTLQVAALSS